MIVARKSLFFGTPGDRAIESVIVTLAPTQQKTSFKLA